MRAIRPGEHKPVSVKFVSKIFVYVFLTVYAASGCATSRSRGMASVQISQNDTSGKTKSAMSQQSFSNDFEGTSGEPINEISDTDEEEPEEDLISEIDDAEFCKDNIYAQYLKNKYLRENPKAKTPEKAFKFARHTRRRRYPTRSPYDQRDVEALFFARTRMVGETVPYFGAIPVVTNPRVEHWIRYFKNSGRNSFLKWLVRGESVRDVVVPILKAEGLPPEFIFLSMVESGFSNQAYSHAKATGPWQFMPGTARLYGLQMNLFIDERRDPAKSTLAAARHLRDLYEEFGDWYLAMAAYNAGPGRVRKAIRMTHSSDFWKLADSAYLPVETKNYVPKVLAALQLASNPAGHGFAVTADPLDTLPTTSVLVKSPSQLIEISTKLNIPEKLLRHWNPELINSVTPPVRQGRDGYPLRLSVNAADKWRFIEPTLEAIEVKDVLVHRIRRGDTIAAIAARYRVDSRRILALNPSIRASRLKIGAEVAVPMTTFVPKSSSTKKQASRDVRSQG
jgi:membrane-bound lytic murein transglycosylase D